MPFHHARSLSPRLPALLAALLLATPALAADDPNDPAPRGPAVTVLKAAKACFNNNVEVSGIVLAREETSVRPDRQGLKVSEILADAGDTVTAGQQLARLTLPEGGNINVTAPVAGLVSQSSAAIGAMAGAKGEALFSIISRSEFDVIGMVPVKDLGKLQVGQQARVKVTGGGEVDARVRRVSPTVEPNSQLGQVVDRHHAGAAVSGEFVRPRADQDRAELQHLGAAHRHPLRHRRHRGAGDPPRAGGNAAGRDRADVGRPGRDQGSGLMEGDIVVARAGALLREGDPVRPVTAADAK